ncbi:hypothetical protein DWG96_23720, partial [Escherichia coli]|nr:hypothetical protein [Escherichia coli]
KKRQLILPQQQFFCLCFLDKKPQQLVYLEINSALFGFISFKFHLMVFDRGQKIVDANKYVFIM